MGHCLPREPRRAPLLQDSDPAQGGQQHSDVPALVWAPVSIPPTPEAHSQGEHGWEGELCGP